MLKKKKTGASETVETTSSSLFSKATFKEGVLSLTMRNHHVYEYRQIPQTLWERFKSAASQGSFYNTYIKNVYQYTRTI